MATELKNLSEFNAEQIPSAAGMKFGIVVAEWNTEVTEALSEGAITLLKQFNAHKIEKITVPGTFELAMGAQFLLEKAEVDAVICIGCVIQGETKHFDFICNASAHGITDLNLKYNKPVIFGVLTPNTMQQAIDRAGGKHGNKGHEAAITAIKMVALKNSILSR